MGDDAALESKFVVWDYVVFVAFLVISLLIGVYFAIQSWRRRHSSKYGRRDDVTGVALVKDGAGEAESTPNAGSAGGTNEFLLGNRKMPMLPISLSILASFLSANTVMGTPGKLKVGWVTLDADCCEFCAHKN